MDRKLMKPPFSDSPVFRPVLYKGGGGWGVCVCAASVWITAHWGLIVRRGRMDSNKEALHPLCSPFQAAPA